MGDQNGQANAGRQLVYTFVGVLALACATVGWMWWLV